MEGWRKREVLKQIAEFLCGSAAVPGLPALWPEMEPAGVRQQQVRARAAVEGKATSTLRFRLAASEGQLTVIKLGGVASSTSH